MKTYCVAQGTLLYGNVNEKKFKKEDICNHIADSLRCEAETNTIWESNYILIKINFKKYIYNIYILQA